MQGPDQYEMDDQLMDELGGAMDSFDAGKMKPIVTITLAVNDGSAEEKKPEDGDDAMPTPEEMDELEKALG
jgi:hypothetical protein